jgi:adenosylcobinamide-phosphate synthase
MADSDHTHIAVRTAAATAAGLVVGIAADAVLGDPRRGHPVALYGRVAGALEQRWYAPTRSRGVAFAAVAVGTPIVFGALAQRFTRRRAALRVVAVAAATWSVLGGTTLRREADAMAAALDRNDLVEARARVPHLCARDPAELGRADIVRATVESVAENTADAVVAPLFWGAVAGLPGLLGYRAVNTLDAMVGYRSLRYEAFGWAAARLDDAANWLPARLTAVLTALVAPVIGGEPREVLRAWRRDGGSHPSPNAGQCEAAAAGALGVRLGGENTYEGRVEKRPALGRGPAPDLVDIRRAATLSGAIALAASALAVAHVASAPLRWRRR